VSRAASGSRMAAGARTPSISCACGEAPLGSPPPAAGSGVDGSAPLAGPRPEGWPSGLRRTLGKRVYGKPYRGFESHSLRQPLLREHSLASDVLLRTARNSAISQVRLFGGNAVAEPETSLDAPFLRGCAVG
jgi:hypothetical protein